MHPQKFGSVVVLCLGLAVALAGCTGEFDIEQTEPFRIQIDDGESDTVSVSADDDDDHRVVVENSGGHDTIDLYVNAEAKSESRTTIIVKVIDEDTDEVYVEREIVVREDTRTDDNDTDDGNETDDDLFDDDRKSEVIQNINIRGSNNVVIVTQAVEGDADVTFKADKASGGSTVSDDDEVDTGSDDDNQTSDFDDPFKNETSS